MSVVKYIMFPFSGNFIFSIGWMRSCPICTTMLPEQSNIDAKRFLRHREDGNAELHAWTNGPERYHPRWYQSVHAGFTQLRVCRRS